MKKSPTAATKETTVKTTIRLSKELLTAARIHALEHGITFQALIEKLVTQHLQTPHKGGK
jgi:predicted DNA binding CopG/RHH family protein